VPSMPESFHACEQKHKHTHKQRMQQNNHLSISQVAANSVPSMPESFHACEQKHKHTHRGCNRITTSAFRKW